MTRVRRAAKRASAAAPPPRDMDASSFARILADLVARVPGAIGAVLVDGGGEAVDYAGALDPFDLKLAGAHWQIVVAQLRRLADATKGFGRPRALVVRGARRSFVAQPLPDDYVVVLLLSRRAGFTVRARAFAVCERALAHEAGWRLRVRASPAWFAADVIATRVGRPSRVRVASRDHAVDVLGRVAAGALVPRERGWRVRLEENGAEVTLVREPGGHWYSDEPLDALFPHDRPRPSSRRIA